MCGIVGIWGGRGEPQSAIEAIGHRGPDDSGIWRDGELTLGHRRLSILDLSPHAAQPMVSACERWVIVYNGEVYNTAELSAGLDARWRGHSDTEVVLEHIAAYGPAETVRAANGMFAFAAWDRAERTLWIARDRMGIKPVYWGLHQGGLYVASELKSVRALGVSPAIDRDVLARYFRTNCVPAPDCIYSGFHALEPGCLARFECPDTPVIDRYWSAPIAADRAKRSCFAGTPDEAVDALESLLSDAVSRRMVADVELGAFLSGGIDSSTVVALMQAQSDRPVKTFTIGFSDEGYNEARHASEVARHLGTQHTELYVSPADARAVIPSLASLYDEPFADSSQIPTHLVSRLARQHVKVALSGDGGDELFAGYNRHFWGPKIWRHARRVPRTLRSLAGASMVRAGAPFWDAIFESFDELGRPLPVRLPTEKLKKFAGILPSQSQRDLYLRLTSHWDQRASGLVLGTDSDGIDHRIFDRLDAMHSKPKFAEWMMLADTLSYLPNDILTKVDRASMGVSLEARVPLLDHRIFEFAWSLDHDLKQRHGQSKWVLRQVLYRHVPRSLIDRPKMGFGVPIDEWLRGPLRAWADDLLSESLLRRQGFLRPDPIQRRWAEHLDGTHNWQHELWDVLMFQSWLETWG